jgi:hypothetical protein
MVAKKQRDEIVTAVIDDVVIMTRNNTLETAAKVAKLYGASDEVVEHILMLRNPPEKEQ